MSRILIAFSAVLVLFSFTLAFANDEGANLFKTQCQGCHGPDGGRAPTKGVAPLKGQSAADLLKMLEGYKDGSFGGQRKQVMVNVVKDLSPEQMKRVADYAAGL